MFLNNFWETIRTFVNRLKSDLILVSSRHKIFTTNLSWIEVCQNIVSSKIDITIDNDKQKSLKSVNNEFCDI